MAEDRFLRVVQIVGQKEVSAEQAEANRKRGKGPMTPRPEIKGIVGCSKAHWWAGVARGIYPKPIRHGSKMTVWRESEVIAAMEKGR